MSKFTVVYDACVLYPAPLRDALMRLVLTDLKNPPLTVETFLATLQKQQLPQTVSKLREFADFL